MKNTMGQFLNLLKLMQEYMCHLNKLISVQQNDLVINDLLKQSGW